MTNDEKIKQSVELIEKKRKELGHKPRAEWKSNGLIKTTGGAEGTFNLNTINDVEKCVSLASYLISKRDYNKQARQILNLETVKDVEISDQIDDIVLRVKMIQWEKKKKDLDVLEAKLKELRSADAKTADAIDELLNTI